MSKHSAAFTPPKLPKGDVARQAVATNRGFTYQTWCAVWAWVTLGPKEKLLLEWSEDYDIASETNVEAIQVKDVAANLTLGGSAARDALNNFWDHCVRNPEFSFSLRYLTRAERGREAENPFDDRKGLDVWESAVQDDKDLGLLRTYLSGQALSEGLLRFIKTATNVELRSRLVNRIRWDTGSPSFDDVRELVKSHLIEHGNRFLPVVPPSDAARVADILFRIVQEETSRDEGRVLTQAQFLTRFEDETSIRMPAGVSAALFSRVLGDSTTNVGLEEIQRVSLPEAAPRSELVRELLSRVQREAVVVLHGSSGMGKSTLAEMVALALPTTAYRVDLRDLEPDAASTQVSRTALAISTFSAGAAILLDDFEGSERIEPAFRRLLAAVQLMGGRLLITAHRPLQLRLRALISGSAITDVDIPPMTDAEVSAVLERRGCPPARLPLWTHLAYIRSAGHPQLADAFAIEKAGAGWPEPTARDINEAPVSISQAKDEARERLVRSLRENDNAYDLAVRLSIFAAPFTREQALMLASSPPPIRHPGRHFERLVGPWFERLPSGRFRPSPLIADLYNGEVPKSDLAAIHCAASEAFVVGKMQGWDVSGALMHALLGENDGVLSALLSSISPKMRDEAWRTYARYLKWLVFWSSDPLYPRNPGLSLLLRNLQFRTAEILDLNSQNVLKDWDREINQLKGKVSELQYDSAKNMFNMSVLNATTRLGLDAIVSAAERVARHPPGERYESAYKGIPFTRQEISDTTEFMVCHQVFDWPRTPADLLELLSRIERASEPLHAILFEALGQSQDTAAQLANQLWLEEARHESPDWQSVYAAYGALETFARRHKLPALSAASVQARAIILAEYLGKEDEAEGVVTEALTEIGEPAKHLNAYRARRRAVAGLHDEALDLLRPILEEWDVERASLTTGIRHRDALFRSHPYADAVASAGALDAWEEAAHWARMGESQARLIPGFELWAIGFRAAQAYALAMFGHICRAVPLFISVLDDLQATPESPRSRAFRRNLTGALSWIEQSLGGRRWGRLQAPDADVMCRLIEVPDKDPGALSVKALWGLLSEIEGLGSCGTEAFYRLLKLDLLNDDSLSAVQVAFARVSGAVRHATAEVVELCAQIEELAEARSAELGKRYAPSTEASRTSVALSNLTAALLVTCTRGPQGHAAPLSEWRESLTRRGLTGIDVERWFDAAELCRRSMRGDRRATATLGSILAHGASPPAKFAAAAALSMTSEDPHVRVFAQALVVIHAANTTFRGAIAASVEAATGIPRVAGDHDAIMSAAKELINRSVAWHPQILDQLKRAASLEAVGDFMLKETRQG